ncbi:MAG: maltokinase [Actinomycetota bacterium]|nr:maltokinase [Actinomycetota bacterium]
MSPVTIDHAQLEELLREWLPRQRWFAGKDRGAEAVRITRDNLLLEGDPALLHLFVDVEQAPTTPVLPTLDAAPGAPAHAAAGALTTTYQLILGIRGELPAYLEHAAVGHLDGAGAVYEASQDHDLMHAVLGWVADEETHGGIVFRREPGAKIDPAAASLALGGEQSNTSVVFGEQTIMKLFRIVVPGLNPDLEVTRALTEMGNPHIATLQGWIETDIDGTPSTLGLLQEFLRTGSDGWALALTSVRDLFAEGDLHAEEVGGDFAAESERLGMATADVHSAMARALPTSMADADTLESLAGSMLRRLEAASAAVPELANHAPTISSIFAALARTRDPVGLQRVHGDFHLGQVMRTDAGWVLLDFEGEPGAPIAARAALSSPLRDVAGMLRSFDYAARYLLADQAGASQLEYRAAEWSERNRDAFCVGYAKVAGRDPREDDVLLRAFELDKAVYEVAYEARNRPDWVGIPLGSIERLVAA